MKSLGLSKLTVGDYVVMEIAGKLSYEKIAYRTGDGNPVVRDVVYDRDTGLPRNAPFAADSSRIHAPGLEIVRKYREAVETGDVNEDHKAICA